MKNGEGIIEAGYRCRPQASTWTCVVPVHPHTCILTHTEHAYAYTHAPCIRTEREKKNLCLFQIPITFFTEVERKILECIQKHKRPKQPNSPEQHTKGVTSPNFKQNDRVTETVSSRCKSRHIDGWKENPSRSLRWQAPPWNTTQLSRREKLRYVEKLGDLQ